MFIARYHLVVLIIYQPTINFSQFLSEMARSASCLWTILVVLHSVSPLI